MLPVSKLNPVCLSSILVMALLPTQGHAQSLDPISIPKYVEPVRVLPALPLSRTIRRPGGIEVDYYEIAARPFTQHILPQSMGLAPTSVFAYGSLADPSSFAYPAGTIEARADRPVSVKWVNDLKDPLTGEFVPSLVPIDQTVHWANPPGGLAERDHHGMDQAPYTGPVPLVTHLHGAHTFEESDGYPEAWYLPNATNIPDGYARVGSFYDRFNEEFQSHYGAPAWASGSATFAYANDQPATTLWYHDHTLGVTRANMYCGLTGFYLIRGGAGDIVRDRRTSLPATLPFPAPARGDAPGIDYHEIPLVLQDRSFNDDGSLFYPDNRAYFEGLNQPPVVPYLDIPFQPDEACDGLPSDVPPIWNSEVFGNAIVVNGRTWPYLNVEPRRYRFRFLNAAQSRSFILHLSNNLSMWQIGSDQGFLPAPLLQQNVIIAPGERADVIIDFTGLLEGSDLTLQNLGPDEPFRGGIPGQDFSPSDPATTGQVMRFNIVPLRSPDRTTPPQYLDFPDVPSPVRTPLRKLSLNEKTSQTVRTISRLNGNVVMRCDDPNADPFTPVASLLGVMTPEKLAFPLMWEQQVTEDPAVGDTETWEFFNFTEDGHPIHIHQVRFRVVSRQALATNDEGIALQPYVLLPGTNRGPEAWEQGFKDTVIALPGEVTRVQMKFDIPGIFVWHCHILEHEDNDMMRPIFVRAQGAQRLSDLNTLLRTGRVRQDQICWSFTTPRPARQPLSGND